MVVGGGWWGVGGGWVVVGGVVVVVVVVVGGSGGGYPSELVNPLNLIKEEEGKWVGYEKIIEIHLYAGGAI